LIIAQQIFQDPAAFQSCKEKMKSFLQIYHDFIQKEMSYLDGFPYCLAELWNPTHGISKLTELLHFSGIYCLQNCNWCEKAKTDDSFKKWNEQQKLQKKYYALGLLVNPKYRNALIYTVQRGQMTIIAHCTGDASCTVFFSLHPELDAFYFEFIHGALIHSLDGERLLRNMRQRTMTNNTAKIGYENRWFRMAKDDMDVDFLSKIDSKQIHSFRLQVKQSSSSTDQLGIIAELENKIKLREQSKKTRTCFG